MDRFQFARWFVRLGLACLLVSLAYSCSSEPEALSSEELLPNGSSARRKPILNPAFAETTVETPVAVMLSGKDPRHEPLVFSIVSPPTNGTLGPVQSTGPKTAEVMYTPNAGFLGQDTFLFAANNSLLSSQNQTATIIVSMPVVFSVEPTQGPAPLTVTATALTADGRPLPAGIYEWNFGGQTEAGPVETHSSRTFTFTQSGLYTVTLSLTLAGASSPISCVTADSAKTSQSLTVGPMISGQVFASDGSGLGGVVVGADNGGTTAITNDNGYYSLHVTYNWSGQITPQREGHTFTPSQRDYSAVTSPLTNQQFWSDQGAGGNQHPVVSAPMQDLTVNEDAAATVIDLTTVFSDSDAGDTLSYSITANGNSSLVSIALSGSSMTLSYAPNGNGIADITVRAQDASGLFAEDELQVTVNPTNDAPSFAVPEDQNTILGIPVVVQLSSVSPGPADESGQTVTFTATSSNQSILPNANIAVSGNQLALTPIAAGGPVTLTVLAQDNGGTAFGGVDVGGPHSFNLTVENASNPIISGTLAPLATVGAQPPIGPRTLYFDGSGIWQASDFEVTTNVGGGYSGVVPAGWTGSISSADPNLILWPESRTFSTPVTAPLVNQDFDAWASPIGIPAPPFGISDSHEMYLGAKFDFDGDGQLESGEEYRDAGNGPYTHYVDNTHANATDTNNPFGTQSSPRLSIPISIPTGSVVEVHGQTYTIGNNATFTANGTSTQPVFLRGVGGSPTIVHTTSVKSLSGSYFVVENLRFDRVRTTVTAHHIVIRHCEIYGYPDRNAVEMSSLENVVYDNYIHDAGENVPLSDRHGITTLSGTEGLWIVDNEIAYCTGDGIQFCHNCLESAAPRHIYIGRNNIHHNTENAVDFKTSRDIVVSQNSLHGHESSDGSDGTAFLIGSNGTTNAAVNIWGIFNDIYDNDGGIRVESAANIDETPGPTYLIANKIHNIEYAALRLEKDGIPVYFVGNTIHDADTGINQDWQQNFAIEAHNNIFANLRGTQFGNHINIQSGVVAGNSTLSHNLFWQDGAPVIIRWGGSLLTYGSTQQMQSFPGGVNNMIANPLFDNVGSADFHIGSESPARDAADGAIMEELAALYEQWSGQDIRKDLDGIARGQTNFCDIGAYEWPEN